MGYPAKTPQPSPLQMIAILQARASGLSTHAIHRRTGHSNSSVARWFDAWGHDAKTFDNWVREHEVDISGHTFDDYYPKASSAIPKPGDRTIKPHTQMATFKTHNGLK